MKEDQIQQNTTANAQHGWMYQAHYLEYTQITENVTGVTKNDRHCDAIMEVDDSTQGSDQTKQAKTRGSQGFMIQSEKSYETEALRREDIMEV